MKSIELRQVGSSESNLWMARIFDHFFRGNFADCCTWLSESGETLFDDLPFDDLCKVYQDLGRNPGWSTVFVTLSIKDDTAIDMFAALTASVTVHLRHYAYSAEKEDQEELLVWVSNDYGVECDCFPLSLEGVTAAFQLRKSGAHIGPRDEPDSGSDEDDEDLRANSN